MIQWRLKKGADRRFRSGHPWVYSNELQGSPKGVEPGAAVELQDAGGAFLARGYGNPHSLIAFRALSRDPEIANPLTQAEIFKALKRCRDLRAASGLWPEFSHRLCFGEADRIPGLVVDRYVLDAPKGAQVWVVQAHTAGIDRHLTEVLGALQELARDEKLDSKQLAIVIRNDLGVRALEGIKEEEPKIHQTIPGLDLSNVKIRVAPAKSGDRPVLYSTDLATGQKTGFFLDQVANVSMALQRIPQVGPAQGSKTIRILDLCCYVGQWSAQLARAFKARGWDVEITLVDASAKALEFARQNAEAEGARCKVIKGDILKDLAPLSDRSFDWVISDPPALIKGRKDIGSGTHAYVQLNTQVFRLVGQQGAVVTCSCSALLEEEEFLKAVSKGAYRNSRQVSWVGRGGHGPDHPMLAEFPEGRYLKAWFGVLSN